MSASANSLLISAILHAALILPLAVAALTGDGEPRAEVRNAFRITLQRVDQMQPQRITLDSQELTAPTDDHQSQAESEKAFQASRLPQKIKQSADSRQTEMAQAAASSDPVQQASTQQSVQAGIIQHALETVSSASRHDQEADGTAQTRVANPAVSEQESETAELTTQSDIVETPIDLKQIAEAYRSLLLEAIAARKTYPMRARRQGLEGEVVVGFTVKGDGEISDIGVVQSSYYRFLDLAAVNTVKQVGRVGPIPALLGKNEWQFQVPLKYALN